MERLFWKNLPNFFKEIMWTFIFASKINILEVSKINIDEV
uniref:Uncharacterized protein n=1 Tax=Marseillevirus LCMAC101 TaxID=2506602 RepID=A0A481YRZ9_9VIRU|nr:MAG: hypothetical protein LCMAC101_00920 [Marseillevirus LCMAC101]